MKYQGAFSRIVGFAGKRFLFSPPPPSSTFFFRFRSNFGAITRLETLATQAKYFQAYDQKWHQTLESAFLTSLYANFADGNVYIFRVDAYGYMEIKPVQS